MQASPQVTGASVAPIAEGATDDFVYSLDATRGFGIRALARILDTVFIYVLIFGASIVAAVALAFAEAAGVTDGGWATRMAGSSLLSIAGSLSATILFHAVGEAVFGATPGKFVCRLRVISEDGRPCTLRGALVRSAAYLVDAMFFGAIAYTNMDSSARKQRLGDRWGKTVVVGAGDVPRSSQKTGPAAVLAFALATLVATSIHAVILVVSGL